jgi:preprotein translocase subunit SecG
MFNFLLIAQCSISFLILSAVLLQKTGKESLGGLKTDLGTPSASNSFLSKITAVLVTLFFINSLMLANVSCKTKLQKKVSMAGIYQYNKHT